MLPSIMSKIDRAARPEARPEAPSAPPSAPPEASTLAPTGPIKVYNRHVSSVGGVPPGQSRVVDRATLAAYPWALRAEE